MVDISPLRGLLYNSEKIGDIARVVSPPYDVIHEEKRKELITCSHSNIVTLILPDGEGDIKYTNASGILKQWMDKEILIYDKSRCFYILEIGFVVNGISRKLRGFIGLTRIEPSSSGKVLSHEKTLTGPKIDRYKLLESCRANFGLIYTIYKVDIDINKILDSVSSGQPFYDFKPCYNNDLSFKVWKIYDPHNIETIKSLMKDRSILIADGHHRYETSSNFKNNPQNDREQKGSQNFVLTLYVDSSQEGLEVYPTHRALSFENHVNLNEFFSSEKEFYDSAPVSVNNGIEVQIKLESFKKENITGFIFYQKDRSYYLKLGPTHPEYISEKPDIFVLHDEILKKIDKYFKIKDITFDHNADKVISAVNSGKAEFGVFLNPPKIQNIERICYSGGLMPQKSTYFWPKPCTGLVMYKL